jgi:hypothetical protein
MTVRERLSNSQLVILRSIFKRSGGRPVSLDAPWQREFVPALSRRGLAEIWYLQSMGDDLALRGPFLTLSTAGERLASILFNRAPRRLSGAGEAT